MITPDIARSVNVFCALSLFVIHTFCGYLFLKEQGWSKKKDFQSKRTKIFWGSYKYAWRTKYHWTFILSMTLLLISVVMQFYGG